MSGQRDPMYGVDAEGNLTLKLGPFRARVVESDEAEASLVVICAEPTPLLLSRFPDHLLASCALCGVTVMHHPEAPRRPPKVCMECAVTVEGHLPGGSRLITKIPWSV